MKNTPKVILFASIAMLLSACGESAPANSSISMEPYTPEQYFNAFKSASEKTSKANDIRVYTPHANVKLGIEESGYGKFTSSGKLYTREGALKESIDASNTSTEEASMKESESLSTNEETPETEEEKVKADTYIETVSDFLVNVDRLPLDLRLHNKEAKNKKEEYVSSFATSIEDVDPKISAKFGSNKLPSVSSGLSIYNDKGTTYVDMSEFSSLFLLIDLGDDVDLNGGKIAYEFDADAIANLILSLSDNDSILSFDEDVYKETEELWSLRNNNEISFSIVGEEKLLDYSVKAFRRSINVDEAKGGDKFAKEGEVAAFQKLLEKAILPLFEFDSASYGIRWNKEGYIDYSYQSFLISKFDEKKFYDFVTNYDGPSLSKFIDKYGGNIEIAPGITLSKINDLLGGMGKNPQYVGDTTSFLLPSGELSFSLGLAYQYEGDDLAPKTLSDKEKAKYKLVEKDDINLAL